MRAPDAPKGCPSTMAHLFHFRVDEAPSQGGVVHRGVASGEGALGLGDGPGGAAHGLDSPANVDVGLAKHHGAGGLGDGVQPGTAKAVDGDPRRLLRETGQEQGHAGDVAVVLTWPGWRNRNRRPRPPKAVCRYGPLGFRGRRRRGRSGRTALRGRAVVAADRGSETAPTTQASLVPPSLILLPSS